MDQARQKALRLIVAAALAASATLARSDFYDGNRLLELCSNYSSGVNQGLCMGFVAGYFDGYFDGVVRTVVNYEIAPESQKRPTFCRAENLTVGQLRDIAVRHIEQNPDKRHLQATLLLHAAFRAAFPCPPL